ncbi:MAG: rRNA maturation RNase YbeY, partial [Chitinophagaceae bacterium]
MPKELTAPTVAFHFEKSCALTQRNELKSFIIKLMKKEGRNPLSLTYIFCSDEYLLNINRDFLQHDYYTDIITFDLSEGDLKSSTRAIVGEIYISIDRVRENARTHKATFAKELHRVMFHGALHLSGFKDKNKTDIAKMRAAED